MNKGIIVTAFAALMVATASFDAAAQDAALEAQLRELAKSPPDVATAGKWFKLKDSVTDNGLRQEILKASAAALILSKKSDVYQARVRPLLDDATGFEESFLAPCSECGGDGTSSKTCTVCKGSGRCHYANCQGGRHRVQQINGDKYENCRECKGSGQCQKCKGKGNLDGKCPRCGGRGRSFKAELAQKAYHDHANAASISIEHKIAQDNRQRASAATEANSNIPRSQPEKGKSSKYEIIPERDDNYEADKQTQTTPSQNSQSEDKTTQDMYASKTLDEVFLDALEALYPANGGKRDIVRAFQGFDKVAKRVKKPVAEYLIKPVQSPEGRILLKRQHMAEFALAHIYWTMTDEEEEKLKSAKVDFDIFWRSWSESRIKMAIIDLRSPLANFESGLIQLGNGYTADGIDLVHKAADAGLQAAKTFLEKANEKSKYRSALAGRLIPPQVIGNEMTRDKEVLAEFMEMCDVELKTEFLHLLMESNGNKK